MDTTWRKQLIEALEENNETFADVVSTTLTEEQLDRVFDNNYGSSQGCAFTLWTAHHVYFPVVYDGVEWVGFVPRNPNGEATRHVGGE